MIPEKLAMQKNGIQKIQNPENSENFEKQNP